MIEMTEAEAERYRCLELARWFHDRAKCWGEHRGRVSIREGHFAVGLEVLPKDQALKKLMKD